MIQMPSGENVEQHRGDKRQVDRLLRVFCLEKALAKIQCY